MKRVTGQYIGHGGTRRSTGRVPYWIWQDEEAAKHELWADDRPNIEDALWTIPPLVSEVRSGCDQESATLH